MTSSFSDSFLKCLFFVSFEVKFTDFKSLIPFCKDYLIGILNVINDHFSTASNCHVTCTVRCGLLSFYGLFISHMCMSILEMNIFSYVVSSDHIIKDSPFRKYKILNFHTDLTFLVCNVHFSSQFSSLKITRQYLIFTNINNRRKRTPPRILRWNVSF